jgi:pimeloyl-ACP methyl ester carboxylesterase
MTTISRKSNLLYDVFMTKRELIVKNRNKKRISATVRIPDEAEHKKTKGTIVLLHGLGGWKEQPLIVILAEQFCRSGYTVLTFDAADGARGPDADFAHSTTTGFLEDLEDIIAHISNAEWHKRGESFILAGHSLGGTVAIHYARLHPEYISKLVLFAPAVSWKSADAFTFIGGLWWLARNKNKTPGPNRSKLPLDKTFVLDFMKFDSKKDASYIAAPTLIVSASRDTSVVSPKAQYELAQRFPNATSMVIPGAGHVFWKNELKLADTILQWLTSS